METATTRQAPMRITDIITAKTAGASVAVETHFEIISAEFQHSSRPFQAYIFLAEYQGVVDDVPFTFRKCYARGCPNNLCTHVSQAVTIANRYLQRDYRELESAGIAIEPVLFTLDDMVVKFERLKEDDQPALTIPELIGLAESKGGMSAEITLAYLPAVEHFANQKNAQTFLSGDITAQAGEESYQCHRCFSCFATDRPHEEKPRAVKVANARLELVYDTFDRAGIRYAKKYFE